MMGAIKEESVGFIFNLEVQVEPAAPVIDQSQLTYIAPNEDGAAEAHAADEAKAARQKQTPTNNTQKPEQGGQGSAFFKS
jgi:preprotein translocase subunit SecA